MTERHDYVCDVCGAEFWQKEEAMKCEAAHLQPCDVKADWQYYWRSHEKYPRTVSVTFADGNSCIYDIRE